MRRKKLTGADPPGNASAQVPATKARSASSFPDHTKPNFPREDSKHRVMFFNRFMIFAIANYKSLRP